jgi:hypothetical protein
MTRLLPRLRSQRAPTEVKPGNSYRREHRHRVVETATVVALRSDPVGIPHVRFNLEFARPDAGRIEGGSRILALRSFVSAYRERVS